MQRINLDSVEELFRIIVQGSFDRANPNRQQFEMIRELLIFYFCKIIQNKNWKGREWHEGAKNNLVHLLKNYCFSKNLSKEFIEYFIKDIQNKGEELQKIAKDENFLERIQDIVFEYQTHNPSVVDLYVKDKDYKIHPETLKSLPTKMVAGISNFEAIMLNPTFAGFSNVTTLADMYATDGIKNSDQQNWLAAIESFKAAIQIEKSKSNLVKYFRLLAGAYNQYEGWLEQQDMPAHKKIFELTETAQAAVVAMRQIPKESSLKSDEEALGVYVKNLIYLFYAWGNYLSNDSLFDSAIEKYHLAMDSLAQLEFTNEIEKLKINILAALAVTLANHGRLLGDNKKDYKEAIQFLEKSIETFSKFSNNLSEEWKRELAIAQCNLVFFMTCYAYNFFNNKKFAEAVCYYRKAKQIYTEIDLHTLKPEEHKKVCEFKWDPRYGLVMALIHQTDVFAEKNEFESIIANDKEAIAELKEIPEEYLTSINSFINLNYMTNLKRTLAKFQFEFAKNCYNNNKMQEAIHYFEETEQTIKNIEESKHTLQDKRLIKDCHRWLRFVKNQFSEFKEPEQKALVLSQFTLFENYFSKKGKNLPTDSQNQNVTGQSQQCLLM